MSTSKRAIRIGSLPRAESSSNLGFWKPKEGETADVTILVDLDQIISVDQFAMWDFSPAPIWVSIGNDDPGYELGIKPGYKAFVPIAIKEDGEVQVKVWSIGIGIHRDLAEIAEMSDSLENQVVRVKRTGTGLTTRYSVMLNGKAKPLAADEIPSVDDIVDGLGPDTREEILTLLLERTGMSWEKLVEKMTGTTEEESGVGLTEF